MVKYLLLSFILLACFFEEGKSCPYFVSLRVEVHLVNKLPPNFVPMTVHCMSKDDDLGNHTVTINQEFNFHFCVVPFRTLFTCDVTWDKRTASFQAYNVKWFTTPCLNGKYCVYEARENGIFLPDGTPWESWRCADGGIC
ncbi:hypothetical protein ACP275_06G172900 [Erythranthe tilingii]